MKMSACSAYLCCEGQLGDWIQYVATVAAGFSATLDGWWADSDLVHGAQCNSRTQKNTRRLQATCW